MLYQDVKPTGFSRSVHESLPEVVNRLAVSLRPEKIVLFGSYAYGAPNKDSDVDLLIIMDTAAQGSERYLAVSRLLYPRPFPVDIVVKTPHEVQAALEKGDFFLKEILTHGPT